MQPMREARENRSRRLFVATGVAAAGVALLPHLVYSQTRRQDMQATIRAGDQTITLVNLFTVAPGQLDSLLDTLRDGTETFFSKMPGFVSSSVLTTRDRTRAINYSQWRSADDIAAFRKDPRFAPYIQKLLALAKPKGMECDVVYVKSS
jgi:heme-degrading monooxygenase HmoA